MKVGKSRIFLFLCIAFVTGIFFGQYLGIVTASVILAVFILVVTIWWKEKRVMFICFLGMFVVFGIWRYDFAEVDRKDLNFIGQHYGQMMEFEGVVIEDPDVREDKVNLTVKSDLFSEKILLNVARYPEYEYGDRILISGDLEEPFESEDFSYRNYLARYGIYALIRFPNIEKVGENEGFFLKKILLSVKHKFKDTLSKILPEPHNALILGLILGLKKSIPDSLKQDFIIAGVSHIIVVSGYNISIITRNILHTRSVLGRRFAFWMSLLAVMSFVVITGAEASVIRASVMGMLLVFALNIGRMYQAVNALVLAGAVMVAINPKILVFDVGFQLSFLATLGLVYLSPIFDKWLNKIPNFLEFRTNLCSTLAAQIFTLPLLIYYFDRVSIVAPIVNVLILWVIPYAMFFGFVAGLLGMGFYPLGQFLGGILWVMLEYMISVTEFFARFELASVSVSINASVMIFMYLIIIGLVWSYRKYKNFYWQLEYIKMKL